MGVGLKTTFYFFEMLRVAGYDDLSAVSACILGDQRMRISASVGRYNHGTFKRTLLAEGVREAVSIDLNGNDGSVVADLSKPITDAALLGRFDVVFDAGTAEHIMDGQWQLFSNAHNLLKPVGLVLGVLPYETRGHGFYGYPEEFFYGMARTSGYTVLDTRLTSVSYKYTKGKHYTFFTLRKERGSEFVSRERWVDPPRDERGFTRFSADYPTFVTKCLVNKLMVEMEVVDGR